MGRLTKLILAAVVLIGGIALAWQYRRPGGDVTADSTPGKPLAAAHLAATDSAGSSGVTRSHDSSNVVPPVASTTQVSQGKNSDDPGVPQLPRAFAGATSGESSAASLDANSATGVALANPHLGSLSGGDQGPTHKVSDGDTLTELAKQYLGNANRWTELYEYNRDVLTNPDLLPIGAELRIPTAPFRPRASDAAPSASPSAAQPTTARPVSQSIDAGSNQAASSGAPSAKLRRLPPVLPEPTGRVLRVAPRTYVVQPGDTLNSIAVKLYGDGAREDLLRDANRKLVSSDQNLRPGTVLVIPLSDR